jgi:hypothetical protein
MVEFGMFTDTPVPDPKLLKLGVEFASMTEFAAEKFE